MQPRSLAPTQAFGAVRRPPSIQDERRFVPAVFLFSGGLMPIPTQTKSQAKTVKRQVALSVRADGAKEVVVTGDFTGWSPDRERLDEIRSGEWSTILELPPGEYQYRLRVDGEWRDDPNAAGRIPNPYGSENCILVVR
jgi:hypothetical protein